MYTNEPLPCDDQWWWQQDQDEEWLHNQMMADRQIFRDKCRSTLEDHKTFASLIVFYWETEDFVRAHAALSAVVMTTKDHGLMMECASLTNLIAWREE